MSFFTDLWDFLNSDADDALERIYRTKSKQWVADHVPDKLAASFAVESGRGLKANSEYVTISAEKIFMPFERIAFDAFYPALYSTIIVGERDGKPRSITVFDCVSDDLKKLSKNMGSKAIVGKKDLVMAVPFRGQSLPATVAVLAVRAADYAEPLLSTLRKVSTIAGIKFFDVASTLAEPLITSVRELIAANDSTQIAYLGNLEPKLGLFLIAAIDKKDFDWNQYGFASDFTLEKNSVPVDSFSYVVLKIEARADRPNWKDIPELRDSYQSFVDEVRRAGSAVLDKVSKERKDVDNALMRFKWACLTSNELCTGDAKRIAEQAEQLFNSFVAADSATLMAQKTDVAPTNEIDSDKTEFKISRLSLNNIRPFR
jgi:hypothetical protein